MDRWLLAEKTPFSLSKIKGPFFFWKKWHVISWYLKPLSRQYQLFCLSNVQLADFRYWAKTSQQMESFYNLSEGFSMYIMRNRIQAQNGTNLSIWDWSAYILYCWLHLSQCNIRTHKVCFENWSACGTLCSGVGPATILGCSDHGFVGHALQMPVVDGISSISRDWKWGILVVVQKCSWATLYGLCSVDFL